MASVAGSDRARTRQHVQNELSQALAKAAELQAELEGFDSDALKSRDSEATGPGSSRRRDSQRGPTACAEVSLGLREYQRYGRQMILSDVGLPGQLKLKQSHILVVGAGGLGCPVLMYLAAAGIGEVTIYDHDTVELSNLHRQVLHNESRIGMPKATSAALSLSLLNSDVKIHPHVDAFTPSLFNPSSPSSSHLINSRYDLVIDCTDNPTTRQFVNAFAVAHGIPLVSGGAVRSEGVVGVYHDILPEPVELGVEGRSPISRGPCYACVFPPTTASEPVTTADDDSVLLREVAEEKAALLGTGACSDEGVLGILCGVVGVVMGSEALRVLLGVALPTLHLLSPLSKSPFRTIKLRTRSAACVTCSTSPSTTTTLAASAFDRLLRSGDYPWEDPLCTLPTPADKASTQLRWTANELLTTTSNGRTSSGTRLIDVRSPTEFGICRIDGSSNIPFKTFLKDPSLALGKAGDDTVVLVCRRGNESFLAARALRRYLASIADRGETRVVDVIGGLAAWSRVVEHFPLY